MVPRTIENTRESDDTICLPDDEELFAGNDVDEFSAVLKNEHSPKILITTPRYNSTRGPTFISDLISVIPNAHYYKRGTYDQKKIVQYANEKEFTFVIVFHTNRREPGHILELIAFFDSSNNSYGLCSCIHSPFQFLCQSELPA
ncbi:hypothetical protein RDI58_027118 [Solanum bulbocastanum]|uniref:Brix domain-containing protein n=1 Tax=Solanum bulbocastanum TaxID=147425 RepID=A0AAN8T063_SOLBU